MPAHSRGTAMSMAAVAPCWHLSTQCERRIQCTHQLPQACPSAPPLPVLLFLQGGMHMCQQCEREQLAMLETARSQGIKVGGCVVWMTCRSCHLHERFWTRASACTLAQWAVRIGDCLQLALQPSAADTTMISRRLALHVPAGCSAARGQAAGTPSGNSSKGCSSATSSGRAAPRQGPRQ